MSVFSLFLSIPTPVTRVPEPPTLDQPPTTKSGHISSFLWKPEFSLIGSSSEIDRFTKSATGSIRTGRNWLSIRLSVLGLLKESNGFAVPAIRGMLFSQGNIRDSSWMSIFSAPAGECGLKDISGFRFEDTLMIDQIRGKLAKSL